ncbi:hypothetical protein [Sinimarinibacterium flocculans]|uniref:hypothetical protein n=1 Tax=Sinimarinibacterium flocculans TaxID=985250 RepID=UPI0035137D9C
MKDENDFVSLPDSLITARNRLRVIGHELVRYSPARAASEAAQYRHSAADYEYSIHKIEFIDQKTGELFIARSGFHTSGKEVLNWVSHFESEERPLGWSILKKWFTDPAHLAVTALAPPYGLALLGLASIGQHGKHREQLRMQELLGRLADRPKFWRPEQYA